MAHKNDEVHKPKLLGCLYRSECSIISDTETTSSAVSHRQKLRKQNNCVFSMYSL